MAIKKQYQAILNALTQQSEQLRTTPEARRDWAGTAAILGLFEETSGKERETFINALGRVIEDHPAPAAAIAELIHIASSLDLAQVEPQVRKLQADPFAAHEEDVKRAITHFLAIRSATKIAPQAAQDTQLARVNGSAGGQNVRGTTSRSRATRG